MKWRKYNIALDFFVSIVFAFLFQNFFFSQKMFYSSTGNIMYIKPTLRLSGNLPTSRQKLQVKILCYAKEQNIHNKVSEP